MWMTNLSLLAADLFVCILLFALPSLARPHILFAVPLPDGCRTSEDGRRRIRWYRWVVGLSIVACFAGMLVPWEGQRVCVAYGLLLLIGVAAAAFFYQYLHLRPLAVPIEHRSRMAELTSEPELVPKFAWLGSGPFLALAAAAYYLHAHWNQIPLRYPVHWGAEGQPNRWANRSDQAVYGPLLLGGELCLWLLIMALATWFGSRRSHFRPVMLGCLIAVEHLVGSLFAVLSVQMLLNLPIWTVAVGPLAFLVPMVVFMYRRWSNPLGDLPEITPNDRWRAGIIYYNPDDAALFVEKRSGLGYTFNFGNPWCWVLIAGMVLIFATAPLVLG